MHRILVPLQGSLAGHSHNTEIVFSMQKMALQVSVYLLFTGCSAKDYFIKKLCYSTCQYIHVYTCIQVLIKTKVSVCNCVYSIIMFRMYT